MASHHHQACFILLGLLSFFSTSVVAVTAGNFDQEFDITWGDNRAKILDNGQLLTLSLDKASGSGIQSKNQYLYGKINMQLKLVPGNSAGTVTAYYVRRPFYVDGTPIREFKNLETKGVAFPTSQPMWIYASLWNGEDWATKGGQVKTDWSQAPFTASFRGFSAEACVWSSAGGSSCPSASFSRDSWFHQTLDAAGQQKIKWAQKNYMNYDYCTDTKRFPQGLPLECSLS
ncbi:hypothetical protein SAY87_006288 [Trapa incisa]|uniref:Xyloglucan endotransglucosylase/hydrolase n=1 Tax=Trapa incisa TaxID=236973 RepID=A0AAN7JYE7_9MYRT|nr:hypothetical protein SAY87_006288 [Trapa incisa]